MHKRFNVPIAILLLVSLTLACSLLRAKRATWHVTLEIDLAAPGREAAAETAVAVIESRLNSLGILNSKVQVQGAPSNGRILVNLPDVPDRERLKKIITAEGLLEMAAVVSPPSPAPATTYNTKEEAVASLGGTVPANRRVLPYVEHGEQLAGGPNTGEAGKQKWVVLESPSIVDGSGLRNASAVQSRRRVDEYEYQIAFSLKQSAADKFGSWTGAHINDYLAVVLNREVKSIAFIKSRISDQGEINGRFTKQSAEDLAMILTSGALPAPVKIVEEGSS